MLKKILLLLFVLILLTAGILIGLSIRDRQVKHEVSMQGLEIPGFTEIEVDFSHVYTRKKSLPFMASAILDIDNDGQEELFLGGGVRQADGLFTLDQDRFVNISDSTGLVKMGGEATLGCAVLDVDKNGYSDLLITRESGVWLYSNNNGRFTGEKLKINLEKGTIPLSVAVSDINRDGHFDMYLAGYRAMAFAIVRPRFKDYDRGGASALFLNNGDDSFTDITESAGIAYRHNSLQGLFIDIDNDKLEDLVVVHETGQVRTWKNMSNLKFRMMSNPNSSEYSCAMGLAVSDYNNDGLVDFFFSNIGSTIPDFIARGDLREGQFLNPEWIMLQNRGDFQFENVARKIQLSDYELGRGAAFEDVNLDGREDLVVAENHPHWPPHMISQLRLFGRLFLQNTKGEFAEIGSAAGIRNQSYGITPLTADFNRDGHPDIVYVNVGGKSKVYLSKKGRNRYLRVKLPDRVESIGATVTVKTLSGKSFSKPFVTGEGLCSDQSHILTFGLGQDKAIDVMVTYLNGDSQRKSGELFDTTVLF